MSGKRSMGSAELVSEDLVKQASSGSEMPHVIILHTVTAVEPLSHATTAI